MSTTDPTQRTQYYDDAEKLMRNYYRNDIGELARKYPNEQRSLHVDWMDIFQVNPEFAYDYVEDPRSMQDILDEALHNFDVPVDVDLSRAHVRVHRPENGDLTYSVGEPRADQRGQYLAIRGQVQKRTKPKPRIVEGVFECERCDTTHRIPQHGSDLQEPFECHGCERKGPFRINHGESRFVDSQIVRIQQPPEEVKENEGRTIDIHLRDDLVEEVSPGDRVDISGVFSLEQSDGDDDPVFDTYVKAHATDVEETDFEEIDTSDYIDEIKALANGAYGDPYELLVESIAPKIRGIPELKLAIALQLFGGTKIEYPDGSVDRGDSHILLMGDPGTGKSSLLRAAEQISPRSSYASGKGASAAGMTAAAVQDDFGDSQWTLEAGALVMANKGLACVDEIDKVDEQAVSSLHDALESQRVNVNKAGINATLPAQTALLAAGNPRYGSFSSDMLPVDQVDIGPTLLSRFDLIFLTQDSVNEERDRSNARHNIEHRQNGIAYMQGDEDAAAEIEPAVELDLLRAYIAYAKQHCTPRIRDEDVFDEAEESFMTMRLMHGEDSENPVPVTFRKLEGIQRLAEASARVRLSDSVETQDVRRARELVMRSMKDVGYDPDGGFDANIIEGGQSRAQADRMDTITAIIRKLSSEHDRGAPVSEVVERAGSKGIEPGKVEHAIEKLKRRGELYNPSSNEDYVRTV